MCNSKDSYTYVQQVVALSNHIPSQEYKLHIIKYFMESEYEKFHIINFKIYNPAIDKVIDNINEIPSELFIPKNQRKFVKYHKPKTKYFDPNYWKLADITLFNDKKTGRTLGNLWDVDPAIWDPSTAIGSFASDETSHEDVSQPKKKKSKT